MQSDEERDKSIDALLARVQALEAEVARLKGKRPAGEGRAVPRKADPRPSEKRFFSRAGTKIEAGKPADTSIENAIGTRWIGRIGVLAILFGMAFFLKYSFDNRLIGETGRVILGIFWGCAFIAAGEVLQKKRNMGLYGQMLSGGGLAVLYLALYAAFALYHLIPAPLAAAGMIAVTTTGLTLSVRYSAYSLAGIALLGGFLTPIMLSTGQNQPVALFSYILLLDLGTLALLRFRPWHLLVTASLAGTALLYAAWHSEFYSDPQRGLAFGVILLFFLLYNLPLLVSRIRSQKDGPLFDRIVIFGSASFFFLAFFAQYHWKPDWPVKSFSLALAAVEIGLALFLKRRAAAARTTIAAYAAASVIMTVIATFVALEQRWIMPALAAEMAALGWFGFRFDLPKVRDGAYLLGLLVLFRFADDVHYYLEPFHRFYPLLNGRFLVCAAAISGFYVLSSFAARHRAQLHTSERHAPAALFIIAQALSLILLSAEAHDFFRFRSPGHFLGWGESHYAYQLSLSVLWALYASVLIGVGIFKGLRGARILGILLLGATVLKVFLLDLSSLQTFYRIISFVVLGVLLLAVSYGYNRFKHLIFGEDHP